MEENGLIENIQKNIIQGRINRDDTGFDEGLEGQPGVIDLVKQAVREGLDIQSVVMDGLTQGMKIVGENYEKGIYLIPDMLASAEAVGEAMEILAPYMEKAGIKSKGKIIMATVKGDLHDIGKNIVSIMLKGAGYEVIDLGTDVSEAKIVDEVIQVSPKFLGLSALLTTTMTEMETVISSLEARGIRSKVKIMIGGAPTSPKFAEKIGADAYCSDAFQAVSFINLTD
jgi:5-methyltetrahydrofolate--homocysteine methyltransferase